MTYIFLILAMTFSAMITVAGRFYNSKNVSQPNASGLYTFLVPTFAALSWLVVWVSDFSFEIKVIPYSLLYAFGYSCFTIGVIEALKVGSTSLTALVKQIALVGVSVWGFLFWDTKFTLISGIGIILIVVSLCLCLITPEKGKNKSLIKWLFCALLITIGNAGCSIVQCYQQMAFDYQHKNMFMFFGVFFAAIVCFALIIRGDKTDIKLVFKSSWIYPFMAGASSALSNVFILLLIKYSVSPAIIYPGIAVGGLMITTIVSIIIFKEKLRTAQWFGIAVGSVALVLLNI